MPTHAKQTPARAAQPPGLVVVAHDTTNVALPLHGDDAVRQHFGVKSSRTQGLERHVFHAFSFDKLNAPLTVPAQADTARLLGVRLHVAAAEVSGPGLPSSPHAVVIGSGPEDSGQEIDLLFAAAQTATAGQPLALAADASQQPAYHAVWYCTAERWTIARLVQVVWAGL